MPEEYLMFHRPTLGADEEAAVVEVLRSGWLTTGAKAKEFERQFAQFRGTRHAVATNSCTAALHIALLGMGVGPGDEVVTTPMTFVSTVNAIVHTGARPVFCDIQPDTLNMDPNALRNVLTSRTRVVIPVHFAGHPCEMDEIVALTDSHGARVLEDAAHAVEAEYRGRPTGSLGDAAAFSFYATKNITTGEGGMLTTNDENLAAAAQVLALHGISRDAWQRYSDHGYRHWEVVAPGFKYNMSDLQAALGLAQLRRVAEFWESRKHLTERYDSLLGDIPALQLMERRDYVKPAYHLYVLRVLPEAPVSRDTFIEELQAKRVGVGVHFRAVHLQQFYREAYGFEAGMFPVAEAAGDTVVSLPLYPTMTAKDVDRVAVATREILGV